MFQGYDSINYGLIEKKKPSSLANCEFKQPTLVCYLKSPSVFSENLSNSYSKTFQIAPKYLIFK